MQRVELALLDGPWLRMVQGVIAVLGMPGYTVRFEFGLYRQFKNLGHLGSGLRAPTGRVHCDDTLVVTDACCAVVFVELLSVECAIRVGAVDEVIDHFVELVVLELLGLLQHDRHEVGKLITGTGMRCRRGEPIDLVDANLAGQRRIADDLVVVDQVGTAANLVRLCT
jgi:hypothetical protein